jgi:hypothetical protein
VTAYSHRCRAAYAAPLNRLPPSVVYRRAVGDGWAGGTNPLCVSALALRPSQRLRLGGKRAVRLGDTYSHRCRAAYAAPLDRLRVRRLPPSRRRRLGWRHGSAPRQRSRFAAEPAPRLGGKRAVRLGDTYSHRCGAAYAAPLENASGAVPASLWPRPARYARGPSPVFRRAESPRGQLRSGRWNEPSSRLTLMSGSDSKGNNWSTTDRDGGPMSPSASAACSRMRSSGFSATGAARGSRRPRPLASFPAFARHSIALQFPAVRNRQFPPTG